MIPMDLITNRQIPLNFYEDNQSTMKIIENGYSQPMRHISRTHRVDLAWLKERFTNDNVKMKYIETQRQCADIFTKHFTDKVKWLGVCTLINHYPNYSDKWLQSGAHVHSTEYDIRDKIPYKLNSHDIHGFDEDELIPFHYADMDMPSNNNGNSKSSRRKPRNKSKKRKTPPSDTDT